MPYSLTEIPSHFPSMDFLTTLNFRLAKMLREITIRHVSLIFREIINALVTNLQIASLSKFIKVWY